MKRIGISIAVAVLLALAPVGNRRQSQKATWSGTIRAHIKRSKEIENSFLDAKRHCHNVFFELPYTSQGFYSYAHTITG